MTVFNRFVPTEEHPSPPAAKMAERGSEEQFRSLIGNIPGAVYRRGCFEPWTMRFISDHIEVLAGYPASEFMQENLRPFESIICPDDRVQVSGVVREALSRGGSFSPRVPPDPRGTAPPGGSPSTAEVPRIPADDRCGSTA